MAAAKKKEYKKPEEKALKQAKPAKKVEKPKKKK